MRLIKTFELIFIFSITLLPNTVLSQETWELKKDKNGIKVWTAEVPTNKIDAYKAEITLNVSAEKLLALLTDFDNACDITFKCEKSLTIKPLQNDKAVYYQKISTPWPADDRDMVCAFSLKREVDGKIYIQTRPSNVTYAKEDGVVRMTTFKDDRIIIPLGPYKCTYIIEGIFDPGGTLPSWLTNMFLTDGPFTSLSQIRDILEK